MDSKSNKFWVFQMHKFIEVKSEKKNENRTVMEYDL